MASQIAFIFDTDALGQIFISGQQNLLSLLTEHYGVRCYLMMEVEVELLSNRRISGLVRHGYQKALKNGWLKVLTASDLEELSKGLKSEVSLQDIRTLANDLRLFIQNGEAHTHAAAILLESPAVSNDYKAIKVLEANAKPLPRNILRSFDLFGFFFSEGVLKEKEAENIRTALKNYSEWLPASMKNSSFVDGLPGIGCRLTTSLAATVSGGWDGTFYLQRTTVEAEEKAPVDDEAPG